MNMNFAVSESLTDIQEDELFETIPIKKSNIELLYNHYFFG